MNAKGPGLKVYIEKRINEGFVSDPKKRNHVCKEQDDGKGQLKKKEKKTCTANCCNLNWCRGLVRGKKNETKR